MSFYCVFRKEFADLKASLKATLEKAKKALSDTVAELEANRRNCKLFEDELTRFDSNESKLFDVQSNLSSQDSDLSEDSEKVFYDAESNVDDEGFWTKIKIINLTISLKTNEKDATSV